MKDYYVYAKCSGGREISLQIEFIGSRSSCKTYIKNKVRNNRPTQFNFISCLAIEAASKRYL